MPKRSKQKEITSRVIRKGETEPLGNDWSGSSPEERIEAVWTLTKLCFGWSDLPEEPRLQRHITHLKHVKPKP